MWKQYNLVKNESQRIPIDLILSKKKNSQGELGVFVDLISICIYLEKNGHIIDIT